MTVVVTSYKVFFMTPTEQPKEPIKPLSEAPRRGNGFSQKALQIPSDLLVLTRGVAHPYYEGLFYNKVTYGNQEWVTESKLKKYNEARKEEERSPKGRARQSAAKAKRRKTLNNNIELPKEAMDALRDVYHTRDDLTLAARSVGSSEDYHVDHIYPLRPAPIDFHGTWQRPYTGLHASWNLQILEASENLSKSNSTPEQSWAY